MSRDSTIKPREDLIEVGGIPLLVVPENCVSAKVCELYHPCVATPSKVGNIDDIPKISMSRTYAMKLGKEFTVTLLVGPIDDEQPFVRMPQIELAHQHLIESLAHIFKRVTKHLASILGCADVHAGGEHNQVREPGRGYHLIDIVQETESGLQINASKSAVSCSYVARMEGYGDSYSREETSLNRVQLPSQLVHLSFVDGDPAYDEVVLDFPRGGVARFV